MLENYEGTAIDTDQFVEAEENPTEDVQSIEGPEQTEEVVETVEPQNIEGTTDESNDPSVPEKYNIPGLGEVTPEEIKEWRNGNLRQSDYTKKTQELARQREENKDALELFEYLRANPQIVEAMKQAEQNPHSIAHRSAPTQENEMLRQLAYNQKALETDLKLSALKQKYGEIDEVTLFNKATELHTDDLEFVYKALNYDGRQVDREALIREAKEQLRAELEADKTAVSTVVSTKQSAPVQNTVTLTNDEKHVAAGMGLTESEYIKWMNN